MHVLIPIAGDPWKPRPSGIMTYAVGLARFLGNRGTSVEFLSAGRAHAEGALRATPVADSISGEFDFVRQLSRHIRRRTFSSDTVVVANTEWYAWAFRRVRPRLRVVLIAHGPSLPTLWTRKPITAAAFRVFVEPRGVNVASAVIAVDREAYEYFTKRYPSAGVHRVPLGIDTDHFRPMARAEARSRWKVDGRPALLFVGRLAVEKRPDLLVAAFREVRAARPEATLLVAGTGPDSDPLRRAMEEFGGETVRLLGFVPRDDLPSLYSAADALLLTSSIEQFPTVMVESLACGTPVFSTDVGDAAAILDDPLLGSICAPSAQGFARAVLQGIPESDADRVGRAEARRGAAERFSWNRVGPQVLGILESGRANVGS